MRLSWVLHRMRNETHYWLCRLKILCMWVLDLEPTNVILKKEGDGAIIYPSPGMITSRCQVQNGNTPECAPARDWPSFNSDVLIGGYDSVRLSYLQSTSRLGPDQGQWHASRCSEFHCRSV